MRHVTYQTFNHNWRIRERVTGFVSIIALCLITGYILAQAPQSDNDRLDRWKEVLINACVADEAEATPAACDLKIRDLAEASFPGCTENVNPGDWFDAAVGWHVLFNTTPVESIIGSIQEICSCPPTI